MVVFTSVLMAAGSSTAIRKISWQIAKSKFIGAARRRVLVCARGCVRWIIWRPLALDIASMTRYVQLPVRKISRVEEAKALMNEAVDWSGLEWLLKKRRVREALDEANAALDKLNHEVKSRWKREIATIYQNLAKPGCGSRAHSNVSDCDPEIRLLAKKVRDADDAAQRARMKAENTFAAATRQWSTHLAREACRQAIRSWELDEKAIRIAEAALDPN
jgi:ElaB/YqjD/DUF883 family membrane-anchored ribosome-binding protein